jgi:hypothetical protein
MMVRTRRFLRLCNLINLMVADENRESFLRFRVGKGRIRQVPLKISCERRAHA